MDKREEEEQRDWDELVEKVEKATSHEEKMKYRHEYMKKWCTGSLDDYDPDDDTVMLVGDPEKVERVCRELTNKKGRG